MSVKPRGILITGEFNLLLNDNLKISSFKRDNVINSKTFYHLKRISSVEVLLRGVWRIAQNWTNHNLRRCYGIPIWGGDVAKMIFCCFCCLITSPQHFFKSVLSGKKICTHTISGYYLLHFIVYWKYEPNFSPKLKE